MKIGRRIFGIRGFRTSKIRFRRWMRLSNNVIISCMIFFSLHIIVMRKEKRSVKITPETNMSTMRQIFHYLHNSIERINQSKIFAGIMMITLNIASRFVNIKISKSMEAYFKYTFSRQLLIFAIAWMGTRDIYISFIVTVLFTLFMDCLLNEECSMCILPKQFTTYHIELSEKDTTNGTAQNVQQKGDGGLISNDEIKKAQETLDKAQTQRRDKENTLAPHGVASFGTTSM